MTKQIYLMIAISIISAISAGSVAYTFSNRSLSEAYNAENKKIYNECLKYVDSIQKTNSVFVDKLANSKALTKCLSENMKDDEVVVTGTASLTPVSEVPLGIKSTSQNSPSVQKESKPTVVSVAEPTPKKTAVVKSAKIEKSEPVPSSEKSSKAPEIPKKAPVQSKECPKKTILRKGWNDPRVQYAYDISCGDMDFIKTIEAESKWDVNASGDSHKSFGLCQIHRGYNLEMQKEYRALKSDNQKVLFCYSQYANWVKRGVIKTRLYGYNVRNKPQNKDSFTFIN